jgi:YjjG family noncanonical pyrimidine nucleotidase
MSASYTWLWFDADGTLFDFDQAEGIALEQAFQSLDAPFDGECLAAYRRINQQLWQALERRTITSDVLPVRRFELLLEALQLPCSPAQLSAAYLEQLALRAELVDGALEVLHALRDRYRFAIVTNGLQAVQRSRLDRSPIREYIAELIISEEVGAAKPRPDFFEAAFARLGYPDKSEVLLIGDSLTSDMQGGVGYGLATCWYNPSGDPRPDDLPITHEITHLRDLLEILDRGD